jgi:hypothetical protein
MLDYDILEIIETRHVGCDVVDLIVSFLFSVAPATFLRMSEFGINVAEETKHTPSITTYVSTRRENRRMGIRNLFYTQHTSYASKKDMTYWLIMDGETTYIGDWGIQQRRPLLMVWFISRWTWSSSSAASVAAIFDLIPKRRRFKSGAVRRGANIIYYSVYMCAGGFYVYHETKVRILHMAL